MKNKYDVLIVLGKNVGYFGSRKKILNSPHYLSLKSEVNVLSAGILYNQGLTKKILFSGGKTAGKDIPSEASAMKKFLIKNFKEIPEVDIILEEISLDTIQNVIETKKIIKRYGFKKIALLTTSKHLPRSLILFNKFNSIPDNSFSSDEVLKKELPKVFENYKNEFGKTEEIMEKLIILLQTTPLLNTFGNKIVEKRRSI